jgi:uncharacterized membrane protein YgdD (TMEM256/DUF423 family)
VNRVFLAVAGLYGALGVGTAAAATHIGGPFLGPASQMLLVHAPLLFALGLWLRPAGWAFPAGGILLMLGVALFAGDLTLRHVSGHSLFPMAAPSGGMLMIAGWLILGVSGLLAYRRDVH